MIRWMRLAAGAVAILSMIALGVGVGLFLVQNGGWIPIEVPPWLRGFFAEEGVEVWLPALLSGWLLALLTLVALLVGSMFYVWRRRQVEALVTRLERELAHLRNLPFEEPAPLEDLPEDPDPEVARALAGPGEGGQAEKDEG